MCFTADYDWRAEVQEVTSGPFDVAVKCDECGKPIAAGEWRKNVYMREREECRECGDSPSRIESDDPAEPCPDSECDFGEVFIYDRCESCDKLERAIKAVELSRGCREQNATPALTDLFEAMVEGEDPADYAAKAAEMFPELVASGYLSRWMDEPEAVSP